MRSIMQTRASVDLSRKVYLALQTVSVDLLAVLAKVRNGKKRATDSAASVCFFSFLSSGFDCFKILGLSVATMDKKFQDRRRLEMARNKPKHAMYGVTQGVIYFGSSIASGVTGLVVKTYQFDTQNERSFHSTSLLFCIYTGTAFGRCQDRRYRRFRWRRWKRSCWCRHKTLGGHV